MCHVSAETPAQLDTDLTVTYSQETPAGLDPSFPTRQIQRDDADYALVVAERYLLPRPPARGDDVPRAFRKGDQGTGFPQGQHLFRKSQRLSRESLIHSRLHGRSGGFDSELPTSSNRRMYYKLRFEKKREKISFRSRRYNRFLEGIAGKE